MTETQTVVFVVGLLTFAGVIWAFRGRITGVRGKGSASQEGVKGSFEIEADSPMAPTQSSTVVKGTRMIGKQQSFTVSKDNTQVEDSLLWGEDQNFSVSNRDPDTSQTEDDSETSA